MTYRVSRSPRLFPAAGTPYLNYGVRVALLLITMPVAATAQHTVPAEHAAQERSSTSRTPQADQTQGQKEDKVSKPKHTNRLIDSTSPYLLQHAHNPVDWHEWSDEAFRKAREEDKPVFLSIGYAACHWCHVMEHESFESEDVAGVLNEYFVSIKVDREERPDIDEIYMAYTVQATGGGGWPMSVWLQPDGSPFMAGTYYPRERFMQILMSIADAWQHERERITTGAESAQRWFQAWAEGAPKAEGVIGETMPKRVAELLVKYFDKERGGIAGGGTNKFPPSMAIELMLRVNDREPNPDMLAAVNTTLDNMARGGIYDHIGGGICRYSTDVEWHVPHFEKMLYDQAMVSDAFLDGFLVTGNQQYATVAADILDYVIEDLQSPDGGIYSSRDADSDGKEGKFYIWTVEEIHEALGEKDAGLFCAYYDVKPAGNWFDPTGHAPQGPKNVLRMLTAHETFARQHDLDADTLTRHLAGWREKLKTIRARRTPPGLDDKILTGWNGLMIASLARGAKVLQSDKYGDAAVRAAQFVLDTLRRDGRLLRSARNGKAHLTGYLSDYAFMIDGLLHLYEATFDRRWLDEAVTLTETAVDHYHDEQRGGFFFTANDAESLIARSRNPRDNAIPSGNSVMAENLLKLSVITGREDYRKRAEGIFQAFAQEVSGNPAAFEKLLSSVDLYHDAPKEIVILGDLKSDETQSLIRTVYTTYLPNKVVMHTSEVSADETLPLLKGKERKNGRTTAFVCENYRCKLPVHEPAALAEQLGSRSAVGTR